ncbi:MAG TPA: hypothetical protein ENH34_01650 [Phycisphaerales bacterium]|nr:hypothetical protein [Phycisphaerales bacterium]
MKKLNALVLVTVAFISLATTAYAVPVEWAVVDGGNGHYYDMLNSPGIKWPDAFNAAQSLTFLGVQGNLATLTSDGENDFVFTYFLENTGIDSVHIGGWQAPGNDPAVGWNWVTGEAWDYTNWGVAQPSDTDGDEDRLTMWAGGLNAGHWNDISQYNGSPGNYGYIVEYAVPEPAILSLLALGALLIRRIRSE